MQNKANFPCFQSKIKGCPKKQSQIGTPKKRQNKSLKKSG
jgi:hypothetical protein